MRDSECARNSWTALSNGVSCEVCNYISIKLLLKKKRQFENKENPYYYVTHLTWHPAHPEPVPAEKSLGIGVALPCDQIMCDWKMTSYGAAFELITLLSFSCSRLCCMEMWVREKVVWAIQ